MRVVPVIDVMKSQAVHAVGGRRHDYLPLASPLIKSADPFEVAVAFRSQFGFNEIYLADLDAIMGADPAYPLFEALKKNRFSMWVDAGIRDRRRVEDLLACGVDTVVLGLETLPGPELLAEVVRNLGEPTVFSLDLKNGSPLGNLDAWPKRDALSIAREAVNLGVNRVLLLDLAQVGSGQGTATKRLVRELRGLFPNLELAVGGGIRDLADLCDLQDQGVDVALAASAFHRGTVTREQLAANLRGPARI